MSGQFSAQYIEASSTTRYILEAELKEYSILSKSSCCCLTPVRFNLIIFPTLNIILVIIADNNRFPQ